MNRPRRRGPQPGIRTRNPQWLAKLDQVRSDLDDRRSLEELDAKLRAWVDQRVLALRAGAISPAEQQMLLDAGITADLPTSAEARKTAFWTEFLDELDWWIDQHGDAHVPQHAVSRNGYPLGKRVKSYRLRYARGSLPAAAVTELERRRGWAWRPQRDLAQQRWNAAFDRLQAAIEAGGTISTIYHSDRSLYEWLRYQREHRNDLPPAQLQRLKRISGALPDVDARAEAFVAAARRWLRKKRGRTMAHLPAREKVQLPDGEDYPLGRRASYYRQRYHGGQGTHPLNPDVATLIESLPGWSWDVDERYQRTRSPSTAVAAPESVASSSRTDRPQGRSRKGARVSDLRYVQGDATNPQGEGRKIIAHVCNDGGAWGAGFVLALSKRWPEPKREYRQWHRGRAGNDFGLGSIQLVTVQPDLWVANMVAQHGIKMPWSRRPPIRYDAVEKCLDSLAAHASALEASVHMPRIGCGLAGGKWEEIAPIIERTLCHRGIDATIYDL